MTVFRERNTVILLQASNDATLRGSDPRVASHPLGTNQEKSWAKPGWYQPGLAACFRAFHLRHLVPSGNEPVPSAISCTLLALVISYLNDAQQARQNPRTRGPGAMNCRLHEEIRTRDRTPQGPAPSPRPGGAARCACRDPGPAAPRTSSRGPSTRTRPRQRAPS